MLYLHSLRHAVLKKLNKLSSSSELATQYPFLICNGQNFVKKRCTISRTQLHAIPSQLTHDLSRRFVSNV